MLSYNFQPNSEDTDRKPFREAKAIVDIAHPGYMAPQTLIYLTQKTVCCQTRQKILEVK